MTRVAAFAFVATLCTACLGSAPDISGDLRNVGSVTVTFKVTPARAKVGQVVRVGFRLVNNAGTEEQLAFPSAQFYDFWATRGEREVWRWSSGRVFNQAVTEQTIGPQSAISFSETWSPVSAGSYVLHGSLTAPGYERELTGRLRVE